MTEPPLVEARNITKRFGPNTALDGVNLEVTAGRTHALAGRNGAGKSTLVSVLTGLLTPDSGEIRFSGELAPSREDRDAWTAKVACVYQHSTIIGDLSVAENLFVNRQQLDGRVIRWKKLRVLAREILDTWSVPVEVDTVARDLSVEHRQLVEIARSLSRGARFIILDEPTAQLDGPAIKRLFGRIQDLQAHGVTFLFISHHLDETYEICQDITVYRDARHVVTAPVSELSKSELISAMTGDAALMGEYRERERYRAGSETVPALAVSSFGRSGEFDGIDFIVGRGEMVGLTGGGGSGKVEVAETIVGLRTPTSGTVSIDGIVPKSGSVRSALDAGVGFVPRDRHHEGLVPQMSVGDNATMTVPKHLGRFGILSARARDSIATTAIADLDIKTDGPGQSVEGLSGGNQQKVVFARALANNPKALVLITPTAGVDVRSKQTLLEVVRGVAETGAGVLIVSDELDDLRDCDRVLVMVHGSVTDKFEHGWRDNQLVAAMEGLA
ncbi:sugar ABC transporter ATP-binding protein [Rhodococcus sp. 14-1411-2a]|uniref:sugar ABC transporter ATP-binding protein n=1 Tax=Rhodococcus sp. 14-1411-2a TaxID=2023151 RepID=UPI000B9B87DA|nr:sugar ABC transporter ATP-binding protein [Rhodococcus sp. 14-1411-2a]OZF52684.1 multidrug ABC transporter ATP-binding protein [Rhodococcus sp. 14-1411-2a]